MNSMPKWVTFEGVKTVIIILLVGIICFLAGQKNHGKVVDNFVTQNAQLIRQKQVAENIINRPETDIEVKKLFRNIGYNVQVPAVLPPSESAKEKKGGSK